MTGVVVNGESLALRERGESLQLGATATFSDGTSEDVTTRATWSTPDFALVLLTTPGRVSAIDGGTARVSAAFGGAVGTVTVDVVVDASAWVFLGAAFAGGVTDTGVTQLIVDPRDDRVLYAAGDRGLFVSRNRGGSWTHAHGIPGTTLNPGALAPDPSDPDRVLYGVRSTLLETTDAGATWHPLHQFDGYIRSVEVSAIDGRHLFVGLQDPANDGINRSTDGGLTWSAAPFPYAVSGVTQFIPWDVAEDPVDGTLYVPTELHDHPAPYRPPAFRSTDRGATWQEITGALPWHGTRVVVHPESQDVLFLTEGAGLFRSTDHGASWARFGNAGFGIDLRLDPNRPERLFGAEVHFSRLGRIFISIDGGETFVPFGLDGLSCGLALSGNSRLLFAACYNNGIWVREIPAAPAQSGAGGVATPRVVFRPG